MKFKKKKIYIYNIKNMYSGEGKRIVAVRSMDMVRILVKPLSG